MPGIEGFAGADVEQLRALATALDDASRRIEGARQRLDGPIRAGVAWTGPWADRFRSDWSSGHAVRLHGASEALHGAAAALRRNADEQAGASAARPSAGWAAGAGATGRAGAGSFAGVTGLAGSIGLAPTAVSRLQLLETSAAAFVLGHVDRLRTSDPTRELSGQVDPEEKQDGEIWAGGGQIHLFERNPTVSTGWHGAVGGVPVSGTYDADAGVSVIGSAAAHVSPLGIAAGAGIVAATHAGLSSTTRIGDFTKKTTAKVEVEGRANASAAAGLTADGAQASVHAGASIVAKAELKQTLSLWGVSLGGHAGVHAGAEAVADAGLSAEKGVYHLNLDAGAAVGLGAGGGVEIAVDPKELAQRLHIKAPW